MRWMPRTWPSTRRSRLLSSSLFSTYPGVMPHTVPGYGDRTRQGRRRTAARAAFARCSVPAFIAVEVGLAEALVAHRAVQVAGVHALADDGQAPRRERDVVVDARQVAAGAGRRSARAGRRRTGSRRRRSGRCGGPSSARVGPVHAEVADVGERVAERAQLPVEHGGDAADVGVGEAVAEAVVAVGDDDALLHGDARRRGASATSSIAGSSRVLEFAHCVRPALELALDVALAAGEVAEADGVDVDGVEVGEHVDEVVAGLRPQRRVEQRRLAPGCRARRRRRSPSRRTAPR